MSRAIQTRKTVKKPVASTLPAYPAEILAEARILTRGGFEFDFKKESGMFWPADGRKLDRDYETATLRIVDTGAVYLLKNLRQPPNALRWSFEVLP